MMSFQIANECFRLKAEKVSVNTLSLSGFPLKF